ncbi:MAG TPA: ABC transporter ATP-binding protein [Myxococcaceae bacterium]|nr:ABC transporter ATP-binding protein [Myxococcaceae bacterium]
MPSVLRRLFEFARPHGRILIPAFACMAMLGATTAAYAYLTGPALGFLLSGGSSGLGAVERFLPASAFSRFRDGLWLLPAAIVAIGVLKGLSYLGQFYWMGLFGQRVAIDLRREIFTRLSGLSPTQLSRQMTGDLLSRFSLDVAAVETAATYAVGSYARDGLQIIALVAVALWINWRLALAALLIVPIAALPVSRLTRLLLSKTREGQARLGDLAAQVKEGLGAVKMIQAFNAQKAEMIRFEAHSAKHRRAMTRAGWARGGIPALMEVLAAIALAGVLAFTALTQSVSPENLISLLTAMVLMYQPAKDLGRVGQFGIQALASGERIFALLDSVRRPVDAIDAKPIAPLRASLRLDDVWFSYGDRAALQGLTLELPIGKVTALVGPSGGGKSTLTSLLLRFDRPQRGHILIDEFDIQQATLDSARAQFALVTQEALLFSTSVLENIRIARPDASNEEVIAAAKVAQADEFIAPLPRGYLTGVGERGVVLSGGQKQRLCLARAILANAPILVLDEATSHLDPQSERELQAALRQLLPGRTALVIAHRLSTIVDADCIHVLDGGRVVESGSHTELLRRGGLYAQLWALQNSDSDGSSADGERAR